MIYFSVSSPRALELGTEDSEVAALCSQSLTMLQDGVRNGVLLVDDAGTLGSAMAAAVAGWPEKYRKKGEELLRRLAKNNRLVGVSAAGPGLDSSSVCETAMAISEACSCDCLVAPSRCLCGGEARLCQSKNALALGDYSLEFPERFKEPTMIFEAGEKVRFEREILSRMFRTAKWVRIIDRLVGGAAKADAGFRVPDNFRRGLTWMMKQLAKYADTTRMSEITLVTAPPLMRTAAGARSRPTSIQSALALRECNAFAEELQNACGVRVRTKQVDGDRLPHDRYLMTDQITLSIGQGFDLLNSDGSLKACGVSILSDEELRKLTRGYPDLCGA